jgi:hypothetical protein
LPGILAFALLGNEDWAFSPWFSVWLATQAVGLGWDDGAPLALGSQKQIPCRE